MMTMMIKKILKFTLKVLIVGTLFFLIGVWVGNYQNHKITPKVALNPTKSEEKRATMVLSEKQQGNLSGHSETPIILPHDEPVVSVPTTGQIKTTITDKRTGEILAEGSTDIKGTTTISSSSTDKGFDVDTSFSSDGLTIAVDVPKDPPKRYEVGALAGISLRGDSFYGMYGRMNLTTLNIGKKLEVTPWVGVAGLIKNNNEPDGYIMAGIAAKF